MDTVDHTTGVQLIRQGIVALLEIRDSLQLFNN